MQLIKQVFPNIFSFGAGAESLFVETIVDTDHDGWESAFNVWTEDGYSGDNLGWIGRYFGNLWASFHFDSIPLGKNQVITSAKFSPYVVDSSGSAKLARIRAQLVADASLPDNSSNKPSGMSLTTTGTATELDNTALSATGEQSWDVTAIVQEIVNQSGWAYGNAMNLIIENNGASGNNYARIALLEHTNTNGSPLTIVA